MNRKYYAIAALIATCAVSYYVAQQKFIAIDLEKLALSDIGVLFLTIIFAAMVIERAVEVYINNRYGPREAPHKGEIRVANLKVVNIEAAIDRETSRMPTGLNEAGQQIRAEYLATLHQDAQTARNNLLSAKSRNEGSLSAISVQKAAEAGLISVVLSLGVAAVGVRVFEQFLELEPAEPGKAVQLSRDATQYAWFQFVDVALTALLLAGGADGVHQLLKDFLKKREDIIPTPAA